MTAMRKNLATTTVAEMTAEAVDSEAAKLVAVRLVGLVRGPAELPVAEVVSVAEVVMVTVGVRVVRVVTIAGDRVVMMELRVASGSRVVRVVMSAGARAVTIAVVTVGVRVVMMVLRVVNGSRVVRVVTIAGARVVSGSRVVRVVIIAGGRVATIAVETVVVPAATIGGSSMTRRRTLRNNVGPKCSPARVRANTAKTNRLLTARTVPSMSWTKVRFEESDSTLRNKYQQNVVLLAIGEAHRFPRPQRSKSRWRARSARRSVIVASTT